MDPEKRIYAQICQLVLHGLNGKVEELARVCPFGDEMKLFDRIRKACHGYSPGIEGEHIFDILRAGIRNPEKFAFIAAYRISRSVDDIDQFLNLKLRSWYRKAEVIETEQRNEGREGTVCLNGWGFRYEEGNDYTIGAQR